MPSPPSPPYPKNCGKSWNKKRVVTGELYGKGGFGKEFKKTLGPLGHLSELKDIGRDRSRQVLIEKKIESAMERLQRGIARASGQGGNRRVLTEAETEVLQSLLYQVVLELVAINDLWDKWVDRKIEMGDAGLASGGSFPLDWGDALTDFDSRCVYKGESLFGQWITPDSPRAEFRVGEYCPTKQELLQRPKDRAAIRKHFIYAFENLRCAQIGYHRILLYKQARAAWKGKDIPELKLPTETDDPMQLVLVDPSLLDMCELFGVCGDDIEPSPDVDELPTCPGEWCIDPDSIPEPGLGDVGPELPPDRPTERQGVKKAMSDATAGVVTVAAAATLFLAYKMLAIRS